jgi:hypothetical protein
LDPRYALYSEYIGVNGIKNEAPMKVEMIVVGRTGHVGVRFDFLRQLKENEIIKDSGDKYT